MADIVEKLSPHVIGIDLGTTNTAAAVFKNQGPVVISIDGAKTMPSVVSIRKNGDVYVGMPAKSRSLLDPENTVSSVKRHIGTDWAKKFEGRSKELTPSDISAMILMKLVEQSQLDIKFELGGVPRYAVICVPANFTDIQRKCTAEAGKAAGLDVLTLLEEPVAAAYAYAVEKDRDQTVLIYDLGGGTFDVSVLKVNSSAGKSQKFSVLAKEGIQRLGGDDIDALLLKEAAKEFHIQSGIELFDMEKDQGISPRKLKEAQQKLLESVINVKHDLSDSVNAFIDIPNLVTDGKGQVHHIDNREVTREEFDDMIRPLITMTREAVKNALTAAELEIDEIDRILLVGGSTKIPLVKNILKEFFGREPYSDTDPDTAIARGAAILGATLLLPDPDIRRPKEDVPAFIIEKHDIVSHNLGIEVVGGMFATLIKKGTAIEPDKPASAESSYTTPRDGMTQLAIRVHQVPREVESVYEEGVVFIGEFYLQGIPMGPAGKEIINVSFEVNDQNMLNVTASCGDAKQLRVLALMHGGPIRTQKTETVDTPDRIWEGVPASEEPEGDPPEAPKEPKPTTRSPMGITLEDIDTDEVEATEAVEHDDLTPKIITEESTVSETSDEPKEE